MAKDPDAKDAIEMLDEVGNAEGAELFAVKDFMVHFALKEKVQKWGEPIIELEGFGEATEEMLRRAYPLHNAAVGRIFAEEKTAPQRTSPDPVEEEKKRQVINDVLRAESVRMEDKPQRMSSDPRIAALQKEVDMPLSMIERLAKSDRRRHDPIPGAFANHRRISRPTPVNPCPPCG